MNIRHPLSMCNQKQKLRARKKENKLHVYANTY